MTLVWFVIWLIANTMGDPERLTVDPVNGWAGTLILVVALDLGRQHAPEFGGSASRRRNYGVRDSGAPDSGPVPGG